MDDAVAGVMRHLDEHVEDEQRALSEFRAIAESLRARMERVEATQEQMPSSATVQSLAISLANLAGDLKAHGARLDGVVNLMARLEMVTARLEGWAKEIGRG